MMKKLCFISTIASPHQVRFCYALQAFFDTTFLFYEHLGPRPKWWNIPLGDRCRVLNCLFTWHAKYLTVAHLRHLQRIKPDIVMLGGFSVPANYLAYLWARWHGCKIVVQTERSRKPDGTPRTFTLGWKILRFLYRRVDRVMVTAADIVPQFRDEFGFGEKVVAGQYPSDIDRYLLHPARGRKEQYTLIFANRLTDIYDPLKAVRIFHQVVRRYPKTRMKMNASGRLRGEVTALLRELGLERSVEFLDDIKSWDDLGEIYRTSDIMILPASFSNGNYSIIEGMASGMGIVFSSKVKGMSSLFTDGESGFICEPEESAFADRVCRFIQDPGLFETFGAVNREKVRPLSLEGTARLYKTLFEPLVG